MAETSPRASLVIVSSRTGRDGGECRRGPGVALAWADDRPAELVHGVLPACNAAGAHSGGIERIAAPQARLNADAGGWTLNTRMGSEQSRRRGLPGRGCAMSAVQQRASLRPIRVFCVHPCCICVESFLRWHVPHRSTRGHRHIATPLRQCAAMVITARRIFFLRSKWVAQADGARRDGPGEAGRGPADCHPGTACREPSVDAFRSALHAGNQPNALEAQHVR